MNTRRAYKSEPIDDYLSSVGLYRKITAKDGSCLFRAVAEQIFCTQYNHYKVREACIDFMSQNREQFEPFIEGSFDHYLFNLKNPKEWAGQVEISALSLLYKRDFLIYQLPGQCPTDVTQNGFKDKIKLCFSNGNHYDSVFTKKFQERAAICQAIVYEILYKGVLRVPHEADKAVEILRESAEFHDDDERAKRRPPLPYRVAKALDPEIYRNVEFDSWNECKKDQQQQDLMLARGLQYSPGEKCEVKLLIDNSFKYFEGHIQDLTSPNGPVTVFIRELGEKRTVPMKNLRPLTSNGPPNIHWNFGGRGAYKNLPGYYQKSAPEFMQDKRRHNRGHGGPPIHILGQHFSNGGAPFDQQNIPYSIYEGRGGRYQGHRLSSPHKNSNQPPRFLNRQLEQSNQYRGRGESQVMHHRRGGRGRHDGHRAHTPDYGMTQDESMSRQDLEEAMRMFDLQERDPSSFPALPGSSNGHGDGGNAGAFWSRYKTEQRSGSPAQRLDTPSPHHHHDGNVIKVIDMEDKSLMGQMQHMSMTPHSGGSPNEVIVSEGHYSMAMKGGDVYVSQQAMGSPGDINQGMPLTNSVPNSTYQIIASSSPSPQTVVTPSPVPSPMGVTFPFYPLMLQGTENLIGPVNAAVEASRDPQGNDLPSDVSTLRYFFNLGVEYYRRICIIQMQQQQQQQQHAAFMQQSMGTPVNTTPVSVYSPIPVMHQSQHPHMDNSHMTMDGHVASNSSLSEEAEDLDEGSIPSGLESGSSSQHFTDTSLQPALPNNSACNQSIHPPQAAHQPVHPQGTQVVYQSPQQGALSMGTYTVHTPSPHWQPYGSPTKFPPISIQSNSPVTLYTSNAPAPAQHMQPQLMPQNQPYMAPSYANTISGTLYNPT